jgi:hypothetical protein
MALVVQGRLKVFGAELWQWLTSDCCRVNYAVKLSQRIRNDARQQGANKGKASIWSSGKICILLDYGTTSEHLEKLPIPDQQLGQPQGTNEHRYLCRRALQLQDDRYQLK